MGRKVDRSARSDRQSVQPCCVDCGKHSDIHVGQTLGIGRICLGGTKQRVVKKHLGIQLFAGLLIQPV